MMVMVCVTKQKTCERLIDAGARLAADLKCDMIIVHVERPGAMFLGNPSEAEALEYLFQTSTAVGAGMIVERAEDIPKKLVDCAKDNHATHIVIGRSPGPQAEAEIHEKLRKKLPNVEMTIV
ncbi:MAG: adenine nucleotide alpha hydrolase family protein [Christensenellales bacterium]